VREAGARAVALVALAFVVAIAAHPFHVDRFLIPGAPFVWVLAALGWSRLLPEPPLRRIAVAGVLAAGAVVLPALDGEWLADRCFQVADPSPELAAYRSAVLAEKRDLSFSRRLLTAGLPRAEAEALLDLVAKEVGPAERFAWIGGNDKLSPAALHLGLLARSGERERFLRDAHERMILTVEGADPKISQTRLETFARRFDVIFATEPCDLGFRPLWEFMARYRAMLLETGQWQEREVGQVLLTRVLRPPEPLRLFAIRSVR
jgi:hypothetical protein